MGTIDDIINRIYKIKKRDTIVYGFFKDDREYVFWVDVRVGSFILSSLRYNLDEIIYMRETITQRYNFKN